MSYHDLARLGVTVRPLSEPRPEPGYTRSQFSAPWLSTIRVLHRELRLLDAEQIVLELDFRERDLRLDGLPRADARLGDPSVAIAFQSRHGPLRYATAEYSDWQDNVRAIALAMEALRAVDRYGVSKRGEQYVGWRQIPQTTGRFQSREQAQRWLEEQGGYRDAARRLHPDNQETGDEEEFKKLQQARELVEATA